VRLRYYAANETHRELLALRLLVEWLEIANSSIVHLLKLLKFPTKTTRTAAYAAVAAKSSCLFAFVNIPIETENRKTKTIKMPMAGTMDLCVPSEVTLYIAITGKTKRPNETNPTMVVVAVSIFAGEYVYTVLVPGEFLDFGLADLAYGANNWSSVSKRTDTSIPRCLDLPQLRLKVNVALDPAVKSAPLRARS
jgi:hypothetical protein